MSALLPPRGNDAMINSWRSGLIYILIDTEKCDDEQMLLKVTATVRPRLKQLTAFSCDVANNNHKIKLYLH